MWKVREKGTKKRKVSFKNEIACFDFVPLMPANNKGPKSKRCKLARGGETGGTQVFKSRRKPQNLSKMAQKKTKRRRCKKI